jgi:DNA-binding transcriptional LysR family regulator
MRFLPGVLSRFAQDYPLINVEVHCEPSSQLLQRNDLDLTIVTRKPGSEARPDPAPGTLCLDGGPRLLAPRANAAAAGNVQYRLFLPNLGL